MQKQDSELPGLNVGRLEPGLWLVAAIFIGLALFGLVDNYLRPWPTGRPGDATPAQLSLFLLALNLPLTVALLYFRIEMDASGLRSRGLLGWRVARWDQVREYYLTPMNPPQGVILTDTGRFNLGCHLMKRKDVRDFVRTHAVAARNADWRLREAFLPAGETRVFQARKSYRDLLVVTCPFFVALGITAWSSYNLGQGAARFTHQQRWMVEGLIMGSYAALIFGAISLFTLLRYRQLKKWNRERGEERIEVTETGIRWSAPGGEIAAAWNEVQLYRTFNDRSRPSPAFRSLVTQRGTIQFDALALENGVILDQIIVRSLPPSARIERSADLGRARSSPEGGVRFDYQSSTHTFLLGAMTFLINLFPLRLGLVTYGWLPFHDSLRSEQISCIVLFSLAAAFVAPGWAGYFYSAVTLTDAGIEQRPIRGRKFVSWSEVRTIRLVAQATHVFVHGEEQPRLKVGALMADPRGLVEEIHRLAPELPIGGTTADGTTRFHTTSLDEIR